MTSSNDENRTLMLHAALDGELDAAGMSEAERLLSTDPAFKAEYARLEALRQAIRTHAPRETAPEALRARLAAAARNGETAVTRRPFPSWRAFAAAIAATAVITSGIQSYVSAIGSPDAVTQAILAGHMRGQISGQPVDVVSTDRHTVKPWLAAKLPFATSVVDLAPQGFTLLGGRIDIVGGDPVPTLVYKRREHLISVTELHAKTGDYPAVPRSLTLDGYPVIVWTDGVRAYMAVSDLAPAELAAFVAAFRQAAAKERDAGGAAEGAN